MEEKQMIKKKEIEDSKKRKNNIRAYKIYEVLAWDLLFYYAIIYLLYSNQKGLSNFQILLIESLFIFFKMFFQAFCQIEIRKNGKRRTLIIGNLSLMICLIILIFANNFSILMFVPTFLGLGFACKESCESDLLYDSIINNSNRSKTFGKIEAKVNSRFYFLDAISAILAGYLYIINPYLPILFCLIITAICFLLSLQFQEINIHEKKEDSIKEEWNKLIKSFDSIKKSNRLKSLLILNSFFIAMHCVFVTLRNVVLINSNVKEEYFGIIFAIGTILAAVSTGYAEKIHKKHKNKSLAHLVIPYAIVFAISGLILFINIDNNIKKICAVLCFSITLSCKGPYLVLIKKYLKNFTNHEKRTSISSAKGFLENSVATLSLLISAFISRFINDKYCLLISGLSFLIFFIVLFKEIKKYVGKKPEDYTKEDLLN